MENVKCSLESILVTFGLILEDMGEEHIADSGCAEAFYTRMDDVYLPALYLIYDSAHNLLKETEAAVWSEFTKKRGLDLNPSESSDENGREHGNIRRNL